jgi:hypothetical protein
MPRTVDSHDIHARVDDAHRVRAKRIFQSLENITNVDAMLESLQIAS